MWILKGKESGYGITTISRHSTRQLAEQAERRLRRKADRANGKPVALNLFIEEQAACPGCGGWLKDCK
jgi:hypothetical protein